MKKITSAAERYLILRSEMEALEKELKSAEASLLVEMQSSGISSTVVSGSKITLVEAARANYDLETLQQLISPALFKRVTKPAVDTKKFKAAVELGQIKPDVADAVTTHTPYTSLRVTSSTDAAPVEKKTRKVA